MLEPALYIVATPIGNLADITRRATEVLEAADIVAAEDTRHTGQLLGSLGISAKLLAYHEHSPEAAAQRLVEAIGAGQAVALVSDAGTPTISDPGYRLVRSVQDAGHAVVPIPGACAAIAALSGSGLPSDRFNFAGFLPSRRAARRQRIATIAGADATQILYEAPHRLREALEDLVEGFGADREAVLARELTKRFETLRRDTLSGLLRWVEEDDNQSRGELVLLLAPAPERPAALPDETLLALLEDLADLVPGRKAAKLLARHSQYSSRELYDVLLSRRDRATSGKEVP
ncbi:MAG: 16S rRNA (cytidine(1402)-2'-O)-methyltransferase [Halieaceae bacterium]|nr:16S rRNA (cytidine(1402)-2'-O)-methyltransferase [Halieaceae bacterium]